MPEYRALVGISIDPVDEGEAPLRFEIGDTVEGVHDDDLAILIAEKAVAALDDEPQTPASGDVIVSASSTTPTSPEAASAPSSAAPAVKPAAPAEEKR